MRVLVVTNMYPPHHFGGYELSCRDVVKRFRARGHDVTVLTTTYRKAGVEPGADDDDESVRRELDFYWRDHRPWLPNGRRILELERHDRRVLRTALRQTKPDVISLWNMGALPLSMIAEATRHKIPIVHHACNDWPRLNLQVDGLRALLQRRPVVTRLTGLLSRVPTKLPDVGASGLFCWVSKFTWDEAEATTPWTFPSSIVVHTGISHDDFPPVDAPEAVKAWHDRLLFVGRIDGRKGVETIVEAMPLLDGMTADLLGSGDERYINRLLTRARELGAGDRVQTAEVPRDQLRPRYLAADAFLFTSLHEPFGLVPIEAMACGTPVIASGVGGSSEFLVDGKNCLLFSPGDAEALAAAVRRLATDHALRLSLVRAGLRTAHEFSVDRLADRLETAHLAAAEGRAISSLTTSV